MSAEYFEPTVRPFPGFNAVEDAKTLRAAMKGLGTDEGAIIDVLTQRSNVQRQQIIVEFKKAFGRELIDDLRSELGGKFEKLILALMETPLHYLAQELHDAMEGYGTDEDVLTEVLCTRTNQEIKDIIEAYKEKYGQSLEEVIQGEVSGDYKSLMILLLTGVRDERGIYPDKAKEQAQKLFDAGEGKWGTEEEVFVVLLAHQSLGQLRIIFDEYQKLSGKSLEDAIKAEFSGKLQTAVLTILRCAQSKPLYYAEKLEKAMKGLGTDDPTLIRLVVSHCESDLGTIKKVYQQTYERSLYDAVTSETSGDYKAAILNLIQP